MPVIHIVDDDEAVRNSLSMVINAADMESRTYDSAEGFLENYKVAESGLECLLLDIRMTGMDGMGLHKKLPELGITLPVIMMTGYGDIATAVKAMKAGAVDFVEKPFNHEDIVERIKQCITKVQARQAHENQVQVLQKGVERLSLLSHREREVFDLLVQGKINKVIASELGISTRTVEAHRAKIMDKLDVKSPFDIARIGVMAENMDQSYNQ